MRGWMIALSAACAIAAGPAAAQSSSRFLASSSLTFHEYFEPFPRVNSAAACRSRCVAIRRCTGWTWYFDLAEWNTLRRACVLGSGLKDAQIGNRYNRTSGFIAGR